MRRVVITGVGVVAPNGIGKDAFWSACVNGKSGVRPIESFDASSHPVKIGAEVPDFDLNPYVPTAHRKSIKIMGRTLVAGANNPIYEWNGDTVAPKLICLVQGGAAAGAMSQELGATTFVTNQQILFVDVEGY